MRVVPNLPITKLYLSRDQYGNLESIVVETCGDDAHSDPYDEIIHRIYQTLPVSVEQIANEIYTENLHKNRIPESIHGSTHTQLSTLQRNRGESRSVTTKQFKVDDKTFYGHSHAIVF